jgi:tetratricopeptide (TPR) repeat protein
MTGRQAEASIQSALSSTPEYGRAHGVMAMIHVMRREFDQAEPELSMADRYDPGSPAIAMFWAQYYAVQGLAEDAIAKAELAVQLSNDSLSSLIGLASIYRQTARFEEMRETLDKALARSEAQSMASEIKQIFGYEQEADEEEDTDDAIAEKDTSAPTGLELKLGGGGGPTLGGGGGPTLGGGGGPKLGGGGGPKLGGQLSPSTGQKPNHSNLKLKLNQN